MYLLHQLRVLIPQPLQRHLHCQVLQIDKAHDMKQDKKELFFHLGINLGYHLENKRLLPYHAKRKHDDQELDLLLQWQKSEVMHLHDLTSGRVLQSDSVPLRTVR